MSGAPLNSFRVEISNLQMYSTIFSNMDWQDIITFKSLGIKYYYPANHNTVWLP